jgi:hypothetical protein
VVTRLDPAIRRLLDEALRLDPTEQELTKHQND